MIGVDVVQIARMEKTYAKLHFQHSIFTEAERCYIEHSPHPIAAAAGIYAAKEAFAKAPCAISKTYKRKLTKRAARLAPFICFISCLGHGLICYAICVLNIKNCMLRSKVT